MAKSAKGKSAKGKSADREPEGRSTPSDESLAADGVEAPSRPASSLGRIVVFHLDGQRYALPIERVQEIQQLVAFTDVPDPSPYMLGLVNLRGNVIPLVDMRVLVGMDPCDHGLQTPMVICRSHDGLVALVVDEVEDVLAVPDDCIQEPPRMHELASRMIGVCRLDQGLVFLLDTDAIVPASAVKGGVEG